MNYCMKKTKLKFLPISSIMVGTAFDSPITFWLSGAFSDKIRKAFTTLIRTCSTLDDNNTTSFAIPPVMKTKSK